MSSFTIKDLENLSGIKAHTIRIWEQRYKFLKPCRTCTNIRYYSQEELKKILGVALLNKYGYKISHIDKMCETEMKERIQALETLEAQHEKVVNDLIVYMAELDSEKLEAAMGDCIAAMGIEEAFNRIIFPLMDRTGVLWLTNPINPIQEKLLSNIIRQKLVAAIEAIPPLPKTGKKILLFLPQGEHNELGVLYMRYLLKNRGYCTIYLGPNVSLDDVADFLASRQPDFIYAHLVYDCRNFKVDGFLEVAAQKFPGIPFIISGKLEHTCRKKIPAGIVLKQSFSEVLSYITTA